MGKIIAVLGLGPSLNLYKNEYDLSIGVNDIWRFHKTDVVVCLDKRTAFNDDRFRVINECTPKAFYSQIVNWDFKEGFVKINFLPHYPNAEISLDIPQFYKSYCSPFVAVQIAFRHYDAKEIHLYGCDMVNHLHLDQKLCTKIKVHFINLKSALEKKGCKLIIYGEGILKDI